MTIKTSDLHRAKRGGAILAACIVQTMNESDSSYQERFLRRLQAAYHFLRDGSVGDVVEEMELLSWTMQYLTGFDPINGKSEPLLADYQPKLT